MDRGATHGVNDLHLQGPPNPPGPLAPPGAAKSSSTTTAKEVDGGPEVCWTGSVELAVRSGVCRMSEVNSAM